MAVFSCPVVWCPENRTEIARVSACSLERDHAGRLVLRAAANPRGMQGYAVGR